MATLRNMFLLGLWAPAGYIAFAASLTGSCPTNQELIANNKCCPGPAMSGDRSGVTYCCVTKPDPECSAALCFNGTCVAKIAVDDSDYDDKVEKALSGSSDDSESSSPSTTSGISITYILDATTTPAGAKTISESLSSNTFVGSNGPTSTTTSDSAGNTNSAASSGNNAVVGMAVGLASLFVIFHN
ncbi:unnamed protein product [Clonostachys byssicola]|uniref:Uncharacterized protein n=1 Tax=Clonostachys byssicola TaxID=160290 RepID=A0A9N9UXV4_9HYPO|nr:unnamed protein product [Clonostachys byssicola]